MEFLNNVFSIRKFMPHGYCLYWEPSLVWTHVISDVLIGLSYYAIPVAGFYYVWEKRDIPLWTATLYASIFFTCGSTHLFGAYTIWVPAYWNEAIVKAVTAVVSVAAAVVLVPLLPRALALPSLRKALAEIGRLNAELERRVAERTALLEATNKELEAFSYSVSHDLRAPLRGMDGFSRALLEDYADKLDATGRDYLERLRAGSQRMAQLIDDMLELSRITRSELRRETVDLSAMAREIAEELRKSRPDRRVEFVVAPGIVVDGDPKLLRLLLGNLLGNAWKFTGKHETARIEFGRQEQEGGTVFFVRDNGAGFDPAYAGKLFGAFQRLHSAAEFEGTGVGLATVQRIVHRHGGRIWAEGEVEKGAAFFFTLAPEAQHG